MTITDSRLNSYQAALREIALTADRFATDREATRTIADAVRTGDTSGVSRALKRLGVPSIGHAGRRPPLDEDPGPTHYEVFRLLPADDQRWDIDIEIHISVSC